MFKPIEFWLNKIHCEKMGQMIIREIPSESIDCIVTDPPYGYSFMGKDWDKAVPNVEWWKCGGFIINKGKRPNGCICDVPLREDNKIKGNFHPTVKPIKLMSYLITLGSREGDIILDPFVGAGSTCIASKILNRKWIGFDCYYEYCEIASARLENCEIVRHDVEQKSEVIIDSDYEKYVKDMQTQEGNGEPKTEQKEQSQSLIETKIEATLAKDTCPKCGTKMYKGKRAYYCTKIDCDGKREIR